MLRCVASAEPSPAVPVYVVDAKREEPLAEFLASVAPTGEPARRGGGTVRPRPRWRCSGAAATSRPRRPASLEPYGARVT